MRGKRAKQIKRSLKKITISAVQREKRLAERKLRWHRLAIFMQSIVIIVLSALIVKAAL